MPKRRAKPTPSKPPAQPVSTAPASAPPSARGLRLARWAPLVLIASALLAYHNSLDGPLIFDDVLNIRNNYKIRRLSPIWETMWGPLDTGVSGRPVVQLSYAVGYAVHGLEPRGYHVVNLALHVATSLVLFGVVRRTLASPRLAPRFGQHADVLALLVTLVWQLHPLLSDSVSYISGRTEVLAALFMVLTLYCAIRAVQSARRARLWHFAAVASCAVGTGCKEIMVVAPLLVLLYDRVFVADSFRQVFRGRVGMYVGLAAAVLVLIPLNLYMADFHRPALVGQEQLSSWDYLKTQSQVLVMYLRLAFWPHPLVFDYFGWDAHPPLARVLPHALLILALLTATVAGLLRRAPAAYCGAWCFLMLAPTSSLLPLPTEIAAERRMYLPLMAIAALVVLAGYRFAGSTRAGRVVGCGALGLMLLAEMGRTYWRNEDFKDPIALWAGVIDYRPDNARAHDNLAYELLGVGREDEAFAHFQEAVRLNPSNFKGMNNVGAILIRRGRYDDAMPYLERSLAVHPTYAPPHLNMGRIRLKRGDLAGAEASIRESLRLQPDRVEALVALAQVLAARGEHGEAERAARAALDLDAQSAGAHDALGLALAAGGREAEALRAFDAALQRAQTDVEYATHLAWLLASAKDPAVRNPKNAAKLASRVAEFTRDTDPAVLDALALAHAADGRFDAAAQTARRALDVARSQRSPRAPKIERRLASYAAGTMPAPDLLVFGN